MLSQQNPISKFWIFEFASQQVLLPSFNEVACEIGDVLRVVSVTDAEKKEICSKFALVRKSKKLIFNWPQYPLTAEVNQGCVRLPNRMGRSDSNLSLPNTVELAIYTARYSNYI